MRAKIIGVPGFEDFEATLIPGLGEIAAVDDRGPLAVVVDDYDCPQVVPASTVHPIDEE